MARGVGANGVAEDEVGVGSRGRSSVRTNASPSGEEHETGRRKPARFVLVASFRQDFGDFFQVGDEALGLSVARFFVRGAEDGGGVDSGEYVGRERRVDELAAMLRDAEGFAEQGLRGCGAEADDYARLEAVNFCVEPGAARGDF